MKIIKVEKEDKDIFTDEQITEFVEFRKILQRIHTRLMREGYIIKEGKINKPDKLQNNGNVIRLSRCQIKKQ